MPTPNDHKIAKAKSNIAMDLSDSKGSGNPTWRRNRRRLKRAWSKAVRRDARAKCSHVN